MKKEYEKLMKELLERRDELVKQEAHFAEDAQVDPTDLAHGDALDITEQATEQERAIAMRHRTAMEIRAINEALEKMHSGSYGICESCEEQIGSKRLAARPFVKYCIECQEDMERAEDDSLPAETYKLDKID